MKSIKISILLTLSLLTTLCSSAMNEWGLANTFSNLAIKEIPEEEHLKRCRSSMENDLADYPDDDTYMENDLADGPDEDACMESNPKRQCKNPEIFNAIYIKNLQQVKELITKDPSVLEQRSNEGFMETPLHFAVVTGDIGIIKELIARGANVNAQDFEGCVPLHLAFEHVAEEPKDHTVTELIRAGTYVDSKNYEGATPLLVISEELTKGSIEAIKVLISAGADVNLQGVNGKTPLHNLVYQYIEYFQRDTHLEEKTRTGLLLEAITVLVSAGASLDIKDNDGQTALQMLKNELQPPEVGAYDTKEQGYITSIIQLLTDYEQRKQDAEQKAFTLEIAQLDQSDKNQSPFSIMPGDMSLLKEIIELSKIAILQAAKAPDLVDFFTNDSNSHIAKNILKDLTLQDLAHLRTTCTKMAKSKLITDDIEAQKLIQEHLDPLGSLEPIESDDTHSLTIFHRLLELGVDPTRLGKESPNGQYYILAERPKRIVSLTGEQRLDTCQCHYIEPSIKDSNNAIIEKIDSIFKSNPTDSFYLAIFPDPSTPNQSRRIDKTFIEKLSHYPIIGLLLSNAIFDDGHRGTETARSLEKLCHLRELIVIDPQNLTLKTEVIEGQTYINNTPLFDSISKLTELRVLGIQQANLFSIPDEVGKLKKLRYLDLSYNDIDLVSPAVASLTELDTLNMTQDGLTALPEQIRHMGRLRALRLAKNFLSTDAIDHIVSYAPNLRLFDLSDMPVSEIPTGISNLRNLETVNVAYTLIDNLPKTLESLPNLHELHLGARVAMTWNSLETLSGKEKFTMFFDNLDEPMKTWPTEKLKNVIEKHELIIKALSLKQIIEEEPYNINSPGIRQKLETIGTTVNRYDYMTKDSVNGYELCHFIREADLACDIKTLEGAILGL